MTKEKIIEMARQAGFERLGHDDCDLVCYPEELETFAKLVAEKERERIISVNASEIERCNSYIKELEDKLARG